MYARAHFDRSSSTFDCSFPKMMTPRRYGDDCVKPTSLTISSHQSKDGWRHYPKPDHHTERFRTYDMITTTTNNGYALYLFTLLLNRHKNIVTTATFLSTGDWWCVATTVNCFRGLLVEWWLRPTTKEPTICYDLRRLRLVISIIIRNTINHVYRNDAPILEFWYRV